MVNVSFEGYIAASITHSRKIASIFIILILTACNLGSIRTPVTMTVEPITIATRSIPSPTRPPTIITPTEAQPSPTMPLYHPSSPSSLGSSENPLVIRLPYTETLVPGALKSWQSWVQHLSQATGLVFSLQPGSPTESEAQLIQQMGTGKVHLAWLSPGAFILGQKQGWVAAAAGYTLGGKAAHAIMLIARADSGLIPGAPSQVFKQLEGKKPCYRRVYPNIPSLVPFEDYILPAGLLSSSGVRTQEPLFIASNADIDPRPQTPEGNVFRQNCDFAWMSATSAFQMKKFLPSDVSEGLMQQWSQVMEILYVTPPILPYGVMSLSTKLDRALQDQLSRAIQSGPGIIPDTGFASFDGGLWGRFGQIVAASGIDLSSYLDQPLVPPKPD